ncbi:heterokaryon incompatibility protein-domain-containing protein [Cladorrhinum sp. PSN332]|nr:heterokaryon incompatibility protein-domain-containing protein [Cladorrhinum sp. PSN332]
MRRWFRSLVGCCSFSKRTGCSTCSNDGDDDTDSSALEQKKPAELPDKKLCKYCQSITIEALGKPKGRSHAPNIETVRRNAEFCSLCRWLQDMKWYHPRAKGQGPLQSPKLGSLSYHIRNVGGAAGEGAAATTTEMWFKTIHGLHTRSMLVYTHQGDAAARYFNVPTKRMLSNTASAQTFDRARAWLKRCQTEHDCASLEIPLPNSTVHWLNRKLQLPWDEKLWASGGGRILPGRLIDLCNFSLSQPDQARLVDTADIEAAEKNKKHGFYSTLSYCRGGEEFLHMYKTATDNSTDSSARAEIPFNSLPRTFQDAFQISKNLGVNFLWIDALCILQDDGQAGSDDDDDDDDWDMESAKMAYIYSQAVFCIAADSSYGASGGCFNNHNNNNKNSNDNNNKTGTGQKPADGRIEIRNRLEGGVGTSTATESTLVVHKAALGDSCEPAAIRDGPLARRGWAYQERILSTRVLHYTSEQLFWECRRKKGVGGYHHIMAEEDEDGDDDDAINASWTYARYRAPSATMNARGVKGYTDACDAGVDGRDAVESWCCDVVEEFSARALTNPEKDKLPALAGVARLYRKAIKRPYVAGVWLCQLGFGLGWYLTSPAPVVVVAGTDRNNSFSWISVHGHEGVKYKRGGGGNRVLYGAEAGAGAGADGVADIPLTVEDWNVSLSNKHDVFGAVGPCSLTLRVLLKPGKLVQRKCSQCQSTCWTVVVAAEILPGDNVSGDDGVVEMGTAMMDTLGDLHPQDVWLFPISNVGRHLHILLVSPVSVSVPVPVPSGSGSGSGSDSPQGGRRRRRRRRRRNGTTTENSTCAPKRFRRLGLLILPRFRFKQTDGRPWADCGRCEMMMGSSPPEREKKYQFWKMKDWFRGCEMQRIKLV